MNSISSLNYPFPINYLFPLRLKLNLKIFRILSFVLIGILLVFYIFQIISIIQKTYLLKNYERELVMIGESNTNLEIEVAKVNALDNIESLIGDLNYEKIGSVKYIQLVEPQVVTK